MPSVLLRTKISQKELSNVFFDSNTWEKIQGALVTYRRTFKFRTVKKINSEKLFFHMKLYGIRSMNKSNVYKTVSFSRTLMKIRFVVFLRYC